MTILYTGPGLSGRSTSIEQIAASSSAKLWQHTIRHGLKVWEGELTAGAAPVQVEVSISQTRSHHFVDVTASTFMSEAEAEEVAFLRRADGAIFVVDSQELRLEHNSEVLQQLEDDLRAMGRDPSSFPLVFQLNKRDLPMVASVDTLTKALQWPKAEYTTSVATRNQGILESLQALLHMA
jgi:hypothetical protein